MPKTLPKDETRRPPNLEGQFPITVEDVNTDGETGVFVFLSAVTLTFNQRN